MAAARERDPSALLDDGAIDEDAGPRYWQSLSGLGLKRQFRFDQTRMWRADFAHVDSRTLIEIEGGIYVQGRHNRRQGFAADAEKYFAALDGWRVLRLTELQITAPIIERVVRMLREASETPVQS